MIGNGAPLHEDGQSPVRNERCGRLDLCEAVPEVRLGHVREAVPRLFRTADGRGDVREVHQPEMPKDDHREGQARQGAEETIGEAI